MSCRIISIEAEPCDDNTSLCQQPKSDVFQQENSHRNPVQRESFNERKLEKTWLLHSRLWVEDDTPIVEDEEEKSQTKASEHCVKTWGLFVFFFSCGLEDIHGNQRRIALEWKLRACTEGAEEI